MPSAENVPPGPRPSRRLDRTAGAIALVTCAALLVMLARVTQLQLSPSKDLAHFISGHITTVPIPSERASLTDRRGRLVAASRLGRRVFVDPVEFPDPADEAIPRLAEALGIDAIKVARLVLPRMERNQEIERSLLSGEVDPEDAATPSRYVVVGRVLDDWREEVVRSLNIPGVHLETRQVRETVGGAVAAPLVGKVGTEDKGLVGLERLLDKALHPEPGKFSYVRNASGDPMWAYPGAYAPPTRSADVRLGLDLEVQRIACEELARGVEECDAAGGRCVVVDPLTGEVLAMVDLLREAPGLVDYDWKSFIPKSGSGRRYRTSPRDPVRAASPELARNRCVEDVYEPGSTFKPFMWAATTELGLARPDEIIDTHWGEWTTPYGRRIADVVKRESQTWKDVLINSSNIGMAQGTARMSFAQMHEAVVRFGFGKRTDIGLPGESPGIITSRKAWSKFTQTSVAMGHEVAVTPLQMARAFCAFARTGELAGTVPSLRLLAAPHEGAAPGKRVLPAKIADLTRETMRGVTHNLDTRLAQKDPGAAAFSYEAFGKSGTAEIPLGLPPAGKKRPKGSDGYYRGQYNSSFIAGGPAADPRLVVVVVIDDPGPELIARRAHYGSQTAGPVNRRIMERALTYLGVPPGPAPSTPSIAGQLRADAGETRPD